MAGLNVEQFRREVNRICAKSEIVVRMTIISESDHHLRLRIFLATFSFVDVYYNPKNGKTAFAQIQRGRRIFGADNTDEIWHWHPLENPEVHQLVDHEITFAEFLRQVETHLSEQ